MEKGGEEVFVGIDVSKDTLAVRLLPTGTCMDFSNREDGLSSMVDSIEKLSPALVILEATGGLETAAVAMIAERGLCYDAFSGHQS